jgi:hypothetical protein
MASVMWVYDRFGAKIGEFTQDVTREWLLNEPGEAEWSLSAGEEMRRLARSGRSLGELTQFGNLIHVPNAKIGDWTGVITKRSWKDGILRVTAKGAEEELFWAAPQAVVKLKGTVGGIFQEMLKIVNSELDTKVLPGNVFMGGTQREETLEGIDLLSEAQRVSERVGNDFDVTGAVTGGRIDLFGNWYEKKGVLTPFLLAEGKNLIKPTGDLLIEDGEEIANRVVGFPDTATKTSSKPVMVQDDTSAQAYGPRFVGQSYTDVTEEDTLLKHCNEVLTAQKNPARVIGCTALRDFDRLRVGNRVQVELYSVGFRDDGSLGTSLTGRITGMRYTDKTNRLELAIEEVLE